MSKQSKALVGQSITIYAATCGIIWALTESGMAFKIFPDWFDKLGFYGYVGIGIPGIFIVGINLIIKKYIFPSLQQITICQFHRSISYLPIYIAEKNGYFRKEGLSVKIIDGNGDDTTWERVKATDADFGVADPLMMLDEKQVKGKVIATIVNRAAIYGLTKKSMAPIKDANELGGKTLAVYKSPSTSYVMLQQIIKDQSLETKTSIKEMTVQSELSYLDDSSIDIVFLPEPMATIAERSNAFRVFSMVDYFGSFLLTGMFATEKYIQENPEIVQKAVNAIERSLRFINTNPLDAAKAVAKEFSEQKRLVAELSTIKLILDDTVPANTAVQLDCWNNSLRARKSNDAVSFPFNEFVDNHFALEAIKNIKKS